MVEQEEQHLVLSVTLEFADGKIHAHTECNCHNRFEYESILSYLEQVKQEVIERSISAGNSEQ